MADVTFANIITENGFSDNVTDYLKGMGRLLYLNSPKDTMFERQEDVPNFFQQSWPYFLIFMIIEHIVLRLEGKPGINMNDSFTSISHGIFQECGRLLWRGAESYLYTWIYVNYRIMDLPWNHALTWYAAALGVDFGYYWMHRACHEIHILWAQHQVHHTSEEFNMGVGVRQSIIQGWCGFVFYLPLALIIPPAQFVMHHQFNYIYMFWIHTKAIGSLGPLEYILNTPSHHRVHHGSNQYCLDVNYGGVLIIWDRLFGTFRPENNKMEIVYGIIHNKPSFNPLYMQIFYNFKVYEKYARMNTWIDKIRAILYRPSWEPEGSTYAIDNPPMNVEDIPKYEVKLPTWCNIYLCAHYIIVLIGFAELTVKHIGMSPISVLIFVFYVIASLTVIGMLFDNSKHAAILEVVRCSTLAYLIKSDVLSNQGLATALQYFYMLSAIFWCLNSLNIFEIKKTSKLD